MEILLRFRYHKIGLVADVEKAFHQVSIAEEDRDVLRFIWIDDILNDNPKLLIYRFTRVVFGVNASPFLLNATIDHHIRSYTDDSAFVELFLSSLYVDDLNGGGDTPGEVLELYEKASQRMSEGGFTLRKWRTNDPDVRKVITQTEVSSRLEDVDANVTEDETTYARTMIGSSGQHESSDSSKVLGIPWDTLRDQLILQTDVFLKFEQPFTKRSLLSATARLYDPLGVISPVILPMKLLFQQLCLEKLDWDAELNDQVKSKIQSWISEFQTLQSIRIPRCYLSGITGKIISTELHGFGDASKAAYAAVVYMRTVTDNEVLVKLVASKTRVAPTANHSIPRLELLSATILARLVCTVANALKHVVKVDEIYCWLDSLTALYWIRQENKEWKPFVQNRVSEIRKNVPVLSWLHCPSEENMADVASRGASLSQLIMDNQWWDGPEWLRLPPSEWPYQKTPIDPTPDVSEEMKASSARQQKRDMTSVMLNDAEEARVYDVSKIINSEDYSNLRRLLRVTAYVSRFLQIIRDKQRTEPRGPLRAEEIEQAEHNWVKAMQRESRKNPKFEQWKQQLGLYEDNQAIIRCRGRIGNAKISHTAKFPALIPSDHHVTSLIINECHQRVGHNGVKETLAELRSRFWIIRGRQVVRKAIFRCATCRRFEGKPYSSLTPAPLPTFRVADDPAFTNTGIDFAGPLLIRPDPKQRDTTAQVHLALFTCASSRSVHLDLVPDLSAPSFIRCFRRFTSRRGIPRRVISDNAKTFKAASKRLSRLFDLQDVQTFLANERVSWNFNLERAPWWGGFFERMIKCTKRCLKKILRRALLSYEELLTVITEIEAILNSRPLTYLDAGDIGEPLTPSHLLMGRRILSIPEPTTNQEGDESNHITLNRRERHISKLLTHFWRRWQTEYLLDLREHHNLSTKKTSVSAIEQGDIVTVYPEKILPKAKWQLGKVEQLITSKDGKVRSAVVRIGNSKGTSTRLRRPIQKLYPLEVRHTESIQPQKVQGSSNDGALRRSTRTAAIVGNFRRQLVDQCLNQN